MKYSFLLDLNERQKNGLLIAIAIVVVILLAQTFNKAYRVDGYDLTSYLLSAEALLQGQNPYITDTPFPYIYPLFLAFSLIPLAILPYWMANLLWFGLSIVSLYLLTKILIKTGSEELETYWGWHLIIPLFLICLISFSPIHNNLLNGQVNLMVVIACVMFFRSFMQNHQVSGAAWLAMAIAIKLVPAILLGFLLVRSKFRFIFLTTVFTIVLCLLPIIVCGEQIFAYYSFYLDSFLLKGITNVGGGTHVLTGFNLQSLVAVFSPALGQQVWVKGASMLTTVVLVLLVDLRNGKPTRDRQQIESFCAYLVGALLLSPMGETHHLVLALPAIIVIGLKLYSNPYCQKTSIKYLTLTFIISFLLLPKIIETKPIYFIPLSILLLLLRLVAQTPLKITNQEPNIK